MVRCRLLFVALLFFVPTVAFAENVQSEQKPIRIGALFTLSSYGAQWGRDELSGAQLAVEEINAAGGVAGRRIELVVEDAATDLQKTVRAMQSLVNVHRVRAVVGPNWAEYAEVVAPIATRGKTLTITPSGYAKGLFREGSFLFSAYPSHAKNMERYAQFIASRAPKKLAFLTSENTFTQEVAEGIKVSLKGHGIVPSYEEVVLPAEGDLRSLIVRLRAEAFDGIVLTLLHGGSMSAFLEQAAALQFRPEIYTTIGVKYDEVLRKRSELVEGVYFFDYPISGDDAFKSAFRSRYQREPGVTSAEAYDVVYFLAQTIRSCGDGEGETLRRCALTITYQGRSGELSFRTNGEIINPTVRLKVFQMVGGVPTEVSF